MSQGVQRFVDTYFTLSDENSFVAKEFYHRTGIEIDEYFIDEELVEEKAFKEEKQKYEGKEKIIFQSSVGTKEFVIDLSDPVKPVLDIIDTVTGGNNRAFIENDPLPITPELMNAFKIYQNFGNVDVRDEPQYATMLFELIHNGYIAKDAPGKSYYSTAFSKGAIQSAMKKYYNLDIDPKMFDFPTEFSSEAAEPFVYQNEVLYIVDSSIYDEYKFIYTPIKVVQIADDLFYAKVQDTAFDFWAFHEAHPDVDYTHFWNSPLKEWPDIAQPFLKAQLPSYLLLKKNGEEYQLLYQGKYNLMDKELAEFNN